MEATALQDGDQLLSIPSGNEGVASKVKRYHKHKSKPYNVAPGHQSQLKDHKTDKDVQENLES
jgi:hypothetical protein